MSQYYDAAMDEIAEQDEELEMEKYNDQQWQEYCDDVDLREMCTKSVDDRRSSMDLVGSSADNALRALSKDEPPGETNTDELQFQLRVKHSSSPFIRILGEQGILRHIFEYDNTYRQTLNNKVLVPLWKQVWNRWYHQIDCPFKRAVMGHLLKIWGVWDNDVHSFSWYKNVSWYRNHYFPDCVHVVLSVNDATNEMDVSVYMNNHGRCLCVFDGKVLTQLQYKQDCLEETGNKISYIDVDEDMESGMVIYTYVG